MQLSDEQNTSSYTLIDPIVVSRDKQHDPMASEITTLTLESKKRTNCYFNATWSLTFIGTKKVEGLRFMIVVGNYTSTKKKYYMADPFLTAKIITLDWESIWSILSTDIVKTFKSNEWPLIWNIIITHYSNIPPSYLFLCTLYVCAQMCVFLTGTTPPLPLAVCHT